MYFIKFICIKIYNNENLIRIDSNTLIYGNNLNLDISNTLFTNITSKISIPVVTNSKYSLINISNTVFSNLK